MNENPTDASMLCVVIRTYVLCVFVMCYLLREEDRSIMVETSAGFSSTFKPVPENCASYMLQPAEKPPLYCYSVFFVPRAGGDRYCDHGGRGVHLQSVR